MLQQALRNIGFYESYPMVSRQSNASNINRTIDLLSSFQGCHYTIDGFCFDFLPSQLAHETTRVWLLLYDMYLRKFVKREPDTVPQKDQLFHEAHLLGK